MRTLLVLLLLVVPVTATGQSRLPLRVCAWEEGAFVRLPAFYDHGSNALFASATGSQAFALPTPASLAYARAGAWYANSDTVALDSVRFGSYRGASVLDEAGLTPAGTYAGVPFFRRPGARAEMVYALVGPGVRPDSSTPYTDGGRCEFQPYRRVAPVSGL